MYGQPDPQRRNDVLVAGVAGFKRDWTCADAAAADFVVRCRAGTSQFCVLPITALISVSFQMGD